MRKQLHIFICFVLSLLLCGTLTFPVFAAEDTIHSGGYTAYENSNGYGIYIEDNADLLSSSEEEDLRDVMEPISEHGNVIFLSLDSNPRYSAESYAADYGYAHFGNESYTIFLIDMDNREICVYSEGAIYKTITSAYARTITDNVYRYASDEEYYECAYHAFSQINSLLEGKRIAQPMKYISNALLAVVLALLINYFIVMRVSRSVKASNAELLNGIFTSVDVRNTRTEFLNQTKKYSPQSSSSSGGRSGGGGGGGSRGGGGSHRF